MSDAAIDNAAVMAAIEKVNSAVLAMRGEIDTLKKPDVVADEKIDRINADVGDAQEVIDQARRARAAATKLLDDIKAARGELPAAKGRGVDRPGRGAPMNHLTGKPLTDEQVAARAEYRDAFKA